ncbi:MAG: RNA-binding S4 domain-containing protein [Oscillospiraceae bacterium]|nr:RNA-binding S4 domain-containing protein [Oscillospiraceae bacterium]
MDKVSSGNGKVKVPVRGVRLVRIHSDFIKLDSLLKLASIVSTGGEAKVLIQSGAVFVSGEPCTQRGKKIRDGDTVRYGGETLVIRSQ